MSVLTHLCRACGHPDDWHHERNRGYSGCPCCRVGASDRDPEPTLLPTFVSPGGSPERLWLPGSRRNAGSMHACDVCDCAACRRAAVALGPVHRAG